MCPICIIHSRTVMWQSCCVSDADLLQYVFNSGAEANEGSKKAAVVTFHLIIMALGRHEIITLVTSSRTNHYGVECN